jgi:hypothetical protein
MTLALTQGIAIGIRRSLWMMLGELVGVALVAIAAVTSMASIMLHYPLAFTLLKRIRDMKGLSANINLRNPIWDLSFSRLYTVMPENSCKQLITFN